MIPIESRGFIGREMDVILKRLARIYEGGDHFVLMADWKHIRAVVMNVDRSAIHDDRAAGGRRRTVHDHARHGAHRSCRLRCWKSVRDIDDQLVAGFNMQGGVLNAFGSDKTIDRVSIDVCAGHISQVELQDACFAEEVLRLDYSASLSKPRTRSRLSESAAGEETTQRGARHGRSQ